MKKDHIRQGDLLFVPISKYAINHQHREIMAEGNRRKDGVIREGEATGHHHRLQNLGDAMLFRPQMGMPIIVVGGHGATVVHEEHGPVQLVPNTTYQVKVAREFDIVEGTRYVAD